MHSRPRQLTTHRADDGFTLIELLVVMVIIGILAGIAIPTFLHQRENGYRAAVKSDLKNASLIIDSAAVDVSGNYTRVTGLAAGQAVPAALAPKVTTGVTLSVNAVSATDYCLQATHANLTGAEVWYLTKSNGTSPTITKPVGCA